MSGQPAIALGMAKEVTAHECRLDALTHEREARNLAAEKASAPKLDLRCRWLG